ncbi:NUMOD4 motif-containing HNH endonuclease [Pararhizobium sp. DWP1-1-3]|uniref:NUMOD4 motif-containing HNH endonuclease n=1 Tax=Pararhizobium sp. DWP1-1-3 TaxID=2804652 RepID=UPI003CEDAE36
MIEEWKDIPGWPDYAVSNFGQVMRIAKPKRGRGRVGAILKARIPGGGSYPAVNLSEAGLSTQWYVHRLVAHVFLGPCPEGEEVNHIDGNKLNPRLDNLEYLTRSDNLLHAFENGLKTNRGQNNPRSVLSEHDVLTIMAEYTGAYGQCASFARRYKVSHAAVQDVIHGRNWSHLRAA